MDEIGFWIAYTGMGIGFGVVLICLVIDEFERRDMSGMGAALCFFVAWVCLMSLLASPISRLVIDISG